ncbi:tetratricopeptide repeat protein [Ramlibacter ginsenosidimutans]|uniref:Ancillary SecYEG translocon subunit n=1 Tax=Ramlibacter ginsenosidimutans TaxID=502333 RepID=A0A934WQ91_9BURK|nr:tetratricopeptide repeat protein [Ramlibacter ginsenosidimutans]MBK6009107.1 tetratricopeptide repeat protein [Ramlibacter ginsenosidimutans]
MAAHLDLEEQEQLDDLKHFWKQYGNLITWLLIVVLGAFAAWNGWQYWQRSQAAQASVLYDEVERAAGAGDTTRVEQAVHDIQDKFGRTAYAAQAGLLAGKALAEKGKPDAAKAALQWVAEHGSDDAYQALARLRLAGLLVESKSYDDALKQLSSGIPAQFQALAADRRGDIYNLQGKKDQARAEYIKAWQGLGNDAEYRGLVAVKLTALGVDTSTLKAAPEGAKS